MELSWSMTAFLGLAIVFLIFWFTSIKINSFWAKRGVRYKISAPNNFGSIINMILMRQYGADFLLDMYKKYQGEKFVGCFYFTSPAVMVRDPELINHILIKDYAYFENRLSPIESYDLFSLSLGNLTGEEWKFAIVLHLHQVN